MIVKIKEDEVLFVDWIHNQMPYSEGLHNYATICIIKKNNVPERAGIARCSKKDNFCRETGRKISLARAVKIYDKETRREIWETYLNRGNGKDLKTKF